MHDKRHCSLQDKMEAGQKNVYCRCWLSDTFPLCNGAHMEHNKATGDNLGPLIVSVSEAGTSTIVKDGK
jgi:CDGSH-type Zn-finger protein